MIKGFWNTVPESFNKILNHYLCKFDSSEKLELNKVIILKEIENFDD